MRLKKESTDEVGPRSAYLHFRVLIWCGYIISMSFYRLPHSFVMARASSLVSCVLSLVAVAVLVVAGVWIPVAGAVSRELELAGRCFEMAWG